MHSKYFFLTLLVALTLAGPVLAAEDVIFQAMQDELSRSMQRLAIENMPKPYFLSYRVEDRETQTIAARCGAITQTERQVTRNFLVEARVGDPSFDNTGFVGSWQDVFNMREDLVEETDYGSLRHQIWLATDAAYKDALEGLARKHAFLQTHPVSEQIPDFTPAKAVEHLDAPVTLTGNITEWETQVRAASRVLAAVPGLQDWSVEYTARAVNNRYLNSDGSRTLKAMVAHTVEVSATTQAADGQRLTAFHRWFKRDELPPSGDELLQAVRKLGEDLAAAAAAPALDEYAGPVLFSDYAAAQLMAQLFAAELSPVREYITAEDWMKEILPAGKLSERLHRRVMPDFVTITDRPDLKEWKGTNLLGYQVVDDEGVPSEAITLVDKGRLVTLPMGRQPTKKLTGSNGHAKALPNQWIQPTVTNLFVKAEGALPKKQLVERLRKLAREFGNEYGLLVTLLDDPQISGAYTWMEQTGDEADGLTMPVLAYKVYEKDGRLEPVRGLVFDEATVRSLRDIAAMGKDEQLYSMLQPSVVSQFPYIFSLETPSILVEEMELKKNTAQEPLPLSPSPLSAK